MKLIAGYQNTKPNGEDLALTPYLFLVNVNGKELKVFGLGLCWLHQSAYLAITFGLPKGFKRFYNHTK